MTGAGVLDWLGEVIEGAGIAFAQGSAPLITLTGGSVKERLDGTFTRVYEVEVRLKARVSGDNTELLEEMEELIDDVLEETLPEGMSEIQLAALPKLSAVKEMVDCACAFSITCEG